ncbi:winged helix-turn-helix transcriptional regulator [Actinacidiphila acidipaludis]|uniref:Helix-turn-helix transcriptional regulator n=1 Tax=Actinacidiphila acidipaludis TaxID=2873382 RepID=A0ABS7Q9M2_9ACTN|nr:helix-turn-helix domain-containing protein [Streptomyces acidipaludis]MBY8879663.1 helix-turn-helix transcriptional regulator [Streptomyces acidipaludis]
MTDVRPRACPIAGSLDVIGERWSLLVLRELFLGVRRYAGILANTGAPRDVLTKRLRSLEAAGVLERRRYQDRPPRFEYHLTPAGRELEPVLVGLREWGLRHLEDAPAPPSLHTCGPDSGTRVVCAGCGEPLDGLAAASEEEQALS